MLCRVCSFAVLAGIGTLAVTFVLPGVLGFCCNVWLWWWISGERDHPTSQAATSNSAAMNSAWALMSLPLMFRTCPFLIIAIAS